MKCPCWLNPAFCLLCIFLVPLVANSPLSVPSVTQEGSGSKSLITGSAPASPSLSPPAWIQQLHHTAAQWHSLKILEVCAWPDLVFGWGQGEVNAVPCIK